MRGRFPNGTLVALALVVAIALSIVYAVLGGDEPLVDRDRGGVTATAKATVSP